MDDRNVANWVGAAALVVVLAAVTWLLVFPTPGTPGGDDQVRVTDRRSRILAARQRPLDQMQRCLDASTGRVGSACVPSDPAPSDVSTPSGRSAQPSDADHALVVAPPPATQTFAPAVHPQASTAPPAPPSNNPPSNNPPSNQPTNHPTNPPSKPPDPTQPPSPHKAPVPGGNTSPPHPGPRP